MKRSVAGLVAALVVVLWPAEASAATPAYDREWAVMPEVFLDEVALAIPKGHDHRRIWRQARDVVLAAYGPIGLSVVVREQLPQQRPVTLNGLQDVTSVPAGYILVHRIGWGVGAGWAAVNDSSAPTAGIIGLPRTYAGFTPKGRRALLTQLHLAHELGHVLGLDHTFTDPSSVMAGGSPLPTAADLEGLIGPEVGLPDPGDPGYWL